MKLVDHAERLAWRAVQAGQSGRDALALALIGEALAVSNAAAAPGFVAHLERIRDIAKGGAAPVFGSAPRAETPSVAATLDALEAWAESTWAMCATGDALRRADADAAAAFVGRARALARLGRFREALPAAREGASLWRAHANADDPPMGGRLAEALRLRGAIEAALGDRDAVATTAEACRLLRALAQEDPARFAPQLSSALHNLAGARLQALDLSGAVSASRASVELRRRIAEEAHPASLLQLAEGLTESGVVLLAAGLSEEALASCAEAVALLKRLIVDEGDDHALTLANALKGLSRAALDAGQWQVGLAAADEEIAIHGALEVRDGDLSSAARAEALHNRASFLTMLGDNAGALDSVEAALSLWRDLAPSPPVNSALAASLHLAGLLSARAGEESGAIDRLEGALRLRRSLSGAPATEDLAATLIELARTYAQAGRLADAAAATQEAADAFAALSRPGAPAQQARALLQAGNLYRKLGAVDDAIGAYAGVERLGDRLRSAGQGDEIVRAALQKLVISLKRAGRTQEAEQWRRRLGDKPPE